jgi:hypothetical protein
VRHLPTVSTHAKDIVTLAAGSLVLGIVALLVPIATRSKLPAQLLRRKA